MPHKRAKRTTRESDKKQRGEDLAPTSVGSILNEHIPKSAARVLNAVKIRQDWKTTKRKIESGHSNDDIKQQDRKRRRLNDADVNDMATTVQAKKRKRRETEMSKNLTIKPGESIQHFNRRVEDDMRPLIKSAVHTSNVTHRNAAAKERKNKAGKNIEREDGLAKDPMQHPNSSTSTRKVHIDKVKEFEKHSSSAPRRLNDIAQAPPEFKNLPRGASDSSKHGSGSAAKRSREGVLSMSQKEMIEQERQNVIKRYRELKAQRQLINT